MPPRTRFTADRILDAALELTRSAGIDAVTARSVAA
jgi:DNA-binding transcriptional regulator YbjK